MVDTEDTVPAACGWLSLRGVASGSTLRGVEAGSFVLSVMSAHALESSTDASDAVLSLSLPSGTATWSNDTTCVAGSAELVVASAVRGNLKPWFRPVVGSAGGGTEATGLPLGCPLSCPLDCFLLVPGVARPRSCRVSRLLGASVLVALRGGINSHGYCALVIPFWLVSVSDGEPDGMTGGERI